MRTPRPLLLLLACLVVPASLSAQESSTPVSATSGPQTPQAATMLQQSIAAMTGGNAVNDVTMTGTVTITTIVNLPSSAPNASPTTSTDSGTVTFVALASGRGEATVTTPAGTRTEIRDVSSGTPTLVETGLDGNTYSVTTQSAATPHPAWFFPAFVMNSGLSSSAYASSYVGQETQNGASVQHLAIWLLPVGQPASSRFPQALTQQDIYLNPTSLLPVSMSFTVHPYDPTSPNREYVRYHGSSVDSLQEVTFSDYQQVEGRQVALHIHTKIQTQFITILSDTQFTSVAFNTGATIAEPAAAN